jgi:hypothetical protein
MKDWKEEILKKTKNEPIPEVFKNEKKMKEKSFDLHILNEYLERSAIVLNNVCKELTKEWESFNVNNVFFLESKAILFEKKYRIRINIQSINQAKNVIFYSRQAIISEQLKDHPEEIKEAVREFVSKVMVDLIKEGIGSLRRETINNNRERINPKEKELEDYLLQYPLKADDVYPDNK